MINNVTLVGRATKDAELRYTSSGTAVANMTLACDRPFKGANGEKETDFIDVVLWRQAAEFAGNNVKKGKMQAVTGRIQTRSYQNNDGHNVKVTEVVANEIRVLEWGNDDKPQTDPFADDGMPLNISDDDLPF